jgi:hypothetical protein
MLVCLQGSTGTFLYDILINLKLHLPDNITAGYKDHLILGQNYTSYGRVLL